VIALSGPAFIAREIKIPGQLSKRFEHRLACTSKKTKRALNEAIIMNVLMGPFMRIAVYKCFIIQLQDRFSKKEGNESEKKSYVQRLEVCVTAARVPNSNDVLAHSPKIIGDLPRNNETVLRLCVVVLVFLVELRVSVIF